MAKKKKNEEGGDFTDELIKSLNTNFKGMVAYNLSVDESPTHVKNWVSTGSKQLDYIIANKKNGGLPEGRIIEIFGPPSIGKSHLAINIAKNTQKMGGIVVYIDSENATSVENLSLLGIDVSKRFVYVDMNCTEDILSVAESTIVKAKALNKDIPLTIIWDSLAGSSPKAEIMGDYDKETIGLQARVLSKGMRKITQVVGNERVTFVILNQMKTKIGVMFGDPMTTPGGLAVPFHASVRVRLDGGTRIKNKDDDVIGINVIAKTIKNKVARPHRRAKFQIHFGVGIKEHEEIFDVLRPAGPRVVNGKEIEVAGTGAWKTLTVTDVKTDDVILEKKFYKADFNDVMNDPVTGPYVEDLLEDVMAKRSDHEELAIDPDSYMDVQSIADEVRGDKDIDDVLDEIST